MNWGRKEKFGRKGYIADSNGRSFWDQHRIVAFCTWQWNEWTMELKPVCRLCVCIFFINAINECVMNYITETHLYALSDSCVMNFAPNILIAAHQYGLSCIWPHSGLPREVTTAARADGHRLSVLPFATWRRRPNWLLTVRQLRYKNYLRQSSKRRAYLWKINRVEVTGFFLLNL